MGYHTAGLALKESAVGRLYCLARGGPFLEASDRGDDQLRSKASPAILPKADGRNARREENKRKVVAAMIALVREGDVSPSAHRVAERAQVGLRSVFRYFEDLDELYSEIGIETDNLVNAFLARHIDGKTWQVRLDAHIRLRAELYEQVLPFFVATQAHRHESAYIASQQTRFVALHRSLVLNMLPEKISNDALRREALILVLSIESWLQLRREQGLGPTEALASVLFAVDRLTRR